MKEKKIIKEDKYKKHHLFTLFQYQLDLQEQVLIPTVEI